MSDETKPKLFLVAVKRAHGDGTPLAKVYRWAEDAYDAKQDVPEYWHRTFPSDYTYTTAEEVANA